jgi:hypothetical protein
MNQTIEQTILQEIKKERTLTKLENLFDKHNVSQEERTDFRKKHKPLIGIQARGEQRKKNLKKLSTEALNEKEKRIEERIKRDQEVLQLVKEERASRG